MVLSGTITSTGRIGERLSISGTRLDTGSPVRFGTKSSIESLRHSAGRQSLLDLVGCRLGVGRKPPPVSGIFAFKLFLLSLFNKPSYSFEYRLKLTQTLKYGLKFKRINAIHVILLIILVEYIAQPNKTLRVTTLTNKSD